MTTRQEESTHDAAMVTHSRKPGGKHRWPELMSIKIRFFVAVEAIYERILT